MKLAENISLSNQFPKEIDFRDVRQYKLQLSDMQILITKLSHFRKCTWWLQVRRCGWGHSLWKSERQPSFIHCFLVFPLQSKKRSVYVLMIFFSLFLLLSFISSWPRSGVAMPFGCLAIGEKKDYNNPSDVTDKYDLGQIVKSWVSQPCSSLVLIWA